MNESEPLQPKPSESDEAIIRDIMEHYGISFDEARQTWEMKKAEINEEIQKRKEEQQDNE